MRYKCTKCSELATWCYMPGFSDSDNEEDDYLCDKCVPRGCSCTDDGSPCCEFDYQQNGYEIDDYN
jgi:hypothetical protein